MSKGRELRSRSWLNSQGRRIHRSLYFYSTRTKRSLVRLIHILLRDRNRTLLRRRLSRQVEALMFHRRDTRLRLLRCRRHESTRFGRHFLLGDEDARLRLLQRVAQRTRFAELGLCWSPESRISIILLLLRELLLGRWGLHLGADIRQGLPQRLFLRREILA